MLGVLCKIWQIERTTRDKCCGFKKKLFQCRALQILYNMHSFSGPLSVMKMYFLRKLVGRFSILIAVEFKSVTYNCVIHICAFVGKGIPS